LSSQVCCLQLNHFEVRFHDLLGMYNENFEHVRSLIKQ
jgi:hypothetical protein